MASYFGVSFVRDGKQVQVRIAPDCYGDARDWHYDCCLSNQANALAAELMREALQKHWHDALRCKIAVMYEQGYRDGRAKRRRKKTFTADLDPGDVGY